MSDPTHDEFDRQGYAEAWAAELGEHVPEWDGTTYAEHRRVKARQHAREVTRREVAARRQAAAPDPDRRA